MTVDTPFMERGEIYLREPRESDVDGPWYAWLNDPEVTRYQDKGIFPNTREKQRAYMQSASSSSSDVLLAIVHRETGTHIGNVGLHDIDWVHRSAQLGIMIGSKDFWGRGYGRDVWNMITEYGFRSDILITLIANRWTLINLVPLNLPLDSRGKVITV